jgi:hypothetical protein
MCSFSFTREISILIIFVTKESTRKIYLTIHVKLAAYITLFCKIDPINYQNQVMVSEFYD